MNKHDTDNILEKKKLYDLTEKVYAIITENFKDNHDPFYSLGAKPIIEGIILCIERIYKNNINENIIIQEMIKLFSYPDLDYYYFWTFIRKETGYIPSMSAPTFQKYLGDFFSYIHSALISGIVDSNILENENFHSKIIKNLKVRKVLKKNIGVRRYKFEVARGPYLKEKYKYKNTKDNIKVIDMIKTYSWHEELKFHFVIHIISKKATISFNNYIPSELILNTIGTSAVLDWNVVPINNNEIEINIWIEGDDNG